MKVIGTEYYHLYSTDMDKFAIWIVKAWKTNLLYTPQIHARPWLCKAFRGLRTLEALKLGVRVR